MAKHRNTSNVVVWALRCGKCGLGRSVAVKGRKPPSKDELGRTCSRCGSTRWQARQGKSMTSAEWESRQAAAARARAESKRRAADEEARAREVNLRREKDARARREALQAERQALERERLTLARAALRESNTWNAQLALPEDHERWMDKIVMSDDPAALLAAIERNVVAPPDDDLEFRLKKAGFSVYAGKRHIGQIRPTGAMIGSRNIHGPMWTDGTLWDAVNRAIKARLEAQTRLPTPSGPSGSRGHGSVWTEWPEQTDPGLADLATQASARIRHERRLTFEFPVSIRLATGELLRLFPVRTKAGRAQRSGPASTIIEAPFEFVGASGETSAALRLRTPSDPLALWVGKSNGDLGRAWALALCAFAELTCSDLLLTPRGPAGHREGQRPVPPQGETVGLRSLSRKVRYDRGLVPTSATAAFLATYVAGHPRRLRPGQRASSENVQAALEVGIQLRSDETWVRPHSRGGPEGGELEFEWTGPS